MKKSSYISLVLLLIAAFSLIFSINSQWKSHVRILELEKLEKELNSGGAESREYSNEIVVADWEEEALAKLELDATLEKLAVLKKSRESIKSKKYNLTSEPEMAEPLYATAYGLFLEQKTSLENNINKDIEQKSVSAVTEDQAVELQTLTDAFSIHREEKVEVANLFVEVVTSLDNMGISLVEENSLSGNNPEKENIMATSGAMTALPGGNNNFKEDKSKKNKLLYRRDLTKEISRGVNLNVYSLRNEKIDIFKRLLYLWEDNPHGGPIQNIISSYSNENPFVRGEICHMVMDFFFCKRVFLCSG